MSTELPEEIRSAIHANRKIEAIKALRESAGIGLKEAKHQVDAYVRAHPDRIEPRAAGSSTGVFLVVGLALAGYGLYRMLF